MSLQDLLDRTIDAPAPPSFDLDRVIARARRGQRRHRLLTVASAAAATVVGTVIWLGGPSQPPVSPPSAPPLGELDAAVVRVIEGEAPDLRWLPGPGPADSWRGGWNAGRTEYHGRGTVSVGGRVGEVQVTIRRYDLAESPTSYSCTEAAAYQCAVNFQSYGLLPGYPFARVHISRQYLDGARWEFRETVYRSDDVLVDVRVDNNAGEAGLTGREPPLLPEQVEDVATDPALTLRR